VPAFYVACRGTAWRRSVLPFTGKRYIIITMIKSFRCKETQRLFEAGKSKRFGTVTKVATRKLAQLDAAETLEFLASPPGNQLEALKDDRKGQHSIRINNQFRVCFRWTDAGPEDVEIVDYH
jgi:proteic killer suppression protein